MHILNIDNPRGRRLAGGLGRVGGWFVTTSDSTDIELEIGRERIDRVLWGERGDVEAAYPGKRVMGWSAWFNFDRTRHMTQGGGISVDAIIDGERKASAGLRADLSLVPPVERPATVFLHMPRTGGTTMRSLLEQDGSISVLPVYDEENAVAWSEVDSLSPEAFDQFDVISGHFSVNPVNLGGRPSRHLTVLREPHEYILSQYFFMKYVTEDPRVTKFDTIFDALNDPGLFDNNFCQLIARSAPEEPVTSEILARAKENIDELFEFVGLTERIPETVDFFTRYLGLKSVNSVPRVNHTPDSEERRRLQLREFRAKSERNVRFDNELYDYVVERFWTTE
jgi:hypothetical protein